jgi:hypothetical protein
MNKDDLAKATTADLYWKEFTLNLKHQIKEVKEFMYVGYQIDNCLMSTLLIPKEIFK